jgi:hypothetical protein
VSHRIVILQSNYIPWKGYFDLLDVADEFILYDDTQYSKNTWRNRNRIKTANGTTWLTVPVLTKGRFGQNIEDVEISEGDWAQRHWRAVSEAYVRAPYWTQYAERFEEMWLGAASERLLSAMNERMLRTLAAMAGITTKITRSTDYAFDRTLTAEPRVIALCQAAGADTYLSGPAGSDYLQPAAFNEAGLELEYIDYSGYPQYKQSHQEFEHAVSIVDTLVHVGDETIDMLRSARRIYSAAELATRGPQSPVT